MRIIRVGDQPDVPWKNGGGTTRELLSAPSGSSGFDWRISVATIAKPGPFSSFPGVDRTLIGLAGEGRLRISGRMENVAPGSVIRFAGDEAVMALVGQEPILVLNIMTANGWRQEIGTSQRARVIDGSPGGTRTFAVLAGGRDSSFRPGDLILGIDDEKELGDVSAIGINLIKPE